MASAAIAIQLASAIALGLVAGSCWPLIRPHMGKKSWVRTILLLAGALTLQIAGVPPIRVLLAAGILGALWREPA